MTYATAIDLIERFGAEEIAQRTDRALPRLVTPELLEEVARGTDPADLSAFDESALGATAVAMTTVGRALADARDTIDGYIGGRYRLPLATVPTVLRRLACDMARYYLYDDQVTDLIRERYTAALKFLQCVARGEVSLGTDGDSGAQPPSEAGAQIVSGGTVWGRDRSKGFL